MCSGAIRLRSTRFAEGLTDRARDVVKKKGITDPNWDTTSSSDNHGPIFYCNISMRIRIHIYLRPIKSQRRCNPLCLIPKRNSSLRIPLPFRPPLPRALLQNSRNIAKPPGACTVSSRVRVEHSAVCDYRLEVLPVGGLELLELRPECLQIRAAGGGRDDVVCYGYVRTGGGCIGMDKGKSGGIRGVGLYIPKCKWVSL